ncbi:hypothetical protein BpHYR1_004097, partial [Brachionus plicatilis]
MRKAYLSYRQSSFKDEKARQELKDYKKAFRQKKRENIAIAKSKLNVKLKRLYKTDKNAFWRELKSINRKTTSITIPLAELKKEYEQLFNDKLVSDEVREKEVTKRVEDFKQKHAG